MRRAALAIAAVLALAAPALRADSYRSYGAFRHAEAMPGVLVLNGIIGPSSTFDLRKALREHEDSHTLFLISPGGNVHAGLELSAIIHDHGLNTVIPPEAECASACAFLFVAGKERRAYGRLGVHQFTSGGAMAGSAAEASSQSVAAQIFDYLKEYDVPSQFMVRMLETPNDSIYWFTPEELRETGIETFSTFGEALEAYAALPDIGVPPEMPEATEPAAVPEPPQTAAEPAPEPAPPQVAMPQPQLQPQPQPQPPARLPQPGFDCNHAGLPAEYAICGDVELADMDRLMTDLYQALRARLSGNARGSLATDQRNWLERRNGCGANADCLKAAYRQRIAQLGG